MKTLVNEIIMHGVGIHSGKKTSIKIKGSEKQGIWFYRSDLDEYIEAIATNVYSTTLATVIKSNTASVSTIEHFLAVCTLLDLTNICVDIDAEEFPIFDGSGKYLAEKILEEGEFLSIPDTEMFLTKDISIIHEGKILTAKPKSRAIYTIKTKFKYFQEESVEFDFCQNNNILEILSARTFGYISDLNKLKAIGLAKGASLENAIAIGEMGEIINPLKLNSKKELTNHKMLDLIGDLRLVGYKLNAEIISEYGGHKINTELAKKILSDEDNYRIVRMSQK